MAFELPPPQNWRAAARLMARDVGPETMMRLLTASRRADAVSFFGILTVLVCLAAGIAVAPVWLMAILIFLQGACLQGAAIIGHDLFVHRKVGGPFWSWIGSLLTFMPALITPTLWGEHHLTHHRHANTRKDQNDVDDLHTPLRKLSFLTLPGLLLATNRLITPESYTPLAVTFRKEFLRLYDWNATVIRRHKIEEALAVVMYVGLIASCVWWPRLFLFGWVLPLTVVTPLLNGLRQATEHMDIDLSNDFSLATLYRPGPILGILYFGEGGERHIIHHLFPSIPNYRREAAVQVLGPILRAQGVREQRSWWRCEYDYFIRGIDRFRFTAPDGREISVPSLIAPPEEWTVVQAPVVTPVAVI
ncbi:MAG: fatty acid desaturase [Candidatus Sericytochromatia bacterium]|nr:fatty acid desaturase [Candidatus Sericytochromatia bacterium]